MRAPLHLPWPWSWILPVVALLAYTTAHAQVYTCVGEDGTRIYSSSRCGPDAKVVPGIGTRKRSTAAPKTVQKPRAEAELEELIRRCYLSDRERGFERLSHAASKYCSD